MILLILMLVSQSFEAQPVNLPVIEPLPRTVKELANDNGTPASFASFWAGGMMAAEKLWSDTADYPLRIDSMKVALYRHDVAFAETTHFVFRIYACDSTGEPQTLLAATDTLYAVIPTAPSWGWFSIRFDTFNVIIDTSQYYFDVAIEWCDPDDSLLSILMDNQTNIPQYLNWFYWPATSTWYEHYSFWSTPAAVGVNMLRAVVTTNVIGVDEHKVARRYSLKVMPNPAHCGEAIFYSLDRAAKVVMKLYDISGSLVLTVNQGDLNEGRHMFKFPKNLAPGIYFLNLKLNDKNHYDKVVIYR
jgi:hypothetical protein